jgi:hypothetical protein
MNQGSMDDKPAQGRPTPGADDLEERLDEDTDGVLAEESEDADGVLADEDEDEERETWAGASGWAISVGAHLLAALIFWYAVWAVAEEDIELPPMRVTAIDPPPKPEEKREIERAVDKEVELNVTTEAETTAPITTLEVVVEEKTMTEEDTEAEQAKGREEAVAAMETGSTGAFMAIGAGGASAGMFGNRNGGGKRRALARGGGSRASESAVDAALRWFKRHQSPDGSWDAEKYPANCSETPKCEPGRNHTGSTTEAALTGYAVLCFLGAGYDHKTPNKYKATVEKGLEWLVKLQNAEGELGNRNYEHAVATMALCEAYAMTNDPVLRQPSQRGIDVLLKRQASDGKDEYARLAWNYTAPTLERNDASVTGWCVMALKSGLAAGLNVGNGMRGAKQWLQRAWEASNPDWKKLNDPYQDVSLFHYTWDAVANQAKGHDHMAPVGALCAVFLGHHAGDIMLESLCNYIMQKQVPKGYPTNTYYMYYNTLAIFQAGGERWQVWNNTVRDLLVNAQRKGEGCFDGSWDYQSTQFHGHEVGRVLSTAYCCLSLEVYYRYKQAGAK